MDGPDQNEKYEFLKTEHLNTINIRDTNRDLWISKLQNHNCRISGHDQEIRRLHPGKNYQIQRDIHVLFLIKKGDTEFILKENSPLIEHFQLNKIGDNLYKLPRTKAS